MIKKITWSSIDRANKVLVYLDDFDVGYRVNYKLMDEKDEKFIFVTAEELLTGMHNTERYGNIQCSASIEKKDYSSDEITMVISRMLNLVLSGQTEGAEEVKLEEEHEDDKLTTLLKVLKEESFRKEICKKFYDVLKSFRLSKGCEIQLESLGMGILETSKERLDVTMSVVLITPMNQHKSLPTEIYIPIEKIVTSSQETIIATIIEEIITVFVDIHGEALLTFGD